MPYRKVDPNEQEAPQVELNLEASGYRPLPPVPVYNPEPVTEAPRRGRRSQTKSEPEESDAGEGNEDELGEVSSEDPSRDEGEGDDEGEGGETGTPS